MANRTKQQERAERAAAALREKQRQERRRRLLAVGGVLVALVLVVGVGFLLQSQRDDSGEALDAEGVPRGTTDTYSVVVGDDSAPSTVTVYEDFQCPICHEFEEQTRDQLRAAVDAGRIKVEYRMVSFLDRVSTNDYSSRALNAAAVVLDTSGIDVFVAFHDLLFDNQPAEGGPGPEDDELVDLAVQAGADEAAVREGIEGGAFDQWVTNTRDQMSKDGVTGTPTVLVDGEQAGSTLGDSIDAALAAAG